MHPRCSHPVKIQQHITLIPPVTAAGNRAIGRDGMQNPDFHRPGASGAAAAGVIVPERERVREQP